MESSPLLQRARLDSALAAEQSVQVELPGSFSPDHDREVLAYVDGKISALELYRRTVARYVNNESLASLPSPGFRQIRRADVALKPVG